MTTNGIGYKIEVDDSEFDRKMESMSAKFEAAFSGGTIYQRSRAEMQQMIADLQEYVKMLNDAYNTRAKMLDEKGIFTPEDEELQALSQRLKEAKKNVSELKEAMRDYKGSSKANLSEAFDVGRYLEGSNAEIKKAISDRSTYLRQLKKEYQDTKAAIESKGGSADKSQFLKNLEKDIKTAQSELEGLRENMRERHLSSENIFAGVTQGARGLMGAFTAAQGAAAMFGAEEEKLQKIQTKLQASMSILMGLQQLGNTLQSTSQFRIQVVNKLMEKWHALNLKVAKSEGIKRAAMAGWAGLIAGTIALLTTLIIKYSKYAQEVKIAKEAQESFKNEFASSASSELATLYKMQAGWKNTNGDIKAQQKFLYQNKSEMESLGIATTNVKNVEEKLFSSASRERIMQKAKAAAYLAQITSMLTKQMELQAKIENEQNRPNTWWEENALTPYAVQEKKDKRIAKWQKEIDKYQKEMDAIQQKYADETWTLTDEVADKKYSQDMASRREAAKKGYESILRLNEDMENKLAEQRNALIQSEFQREQAQLRQNHEKRLQEIEREKKDYIEKLKEQAKLEFLAGNPNANAEDFGTNWKPSAKQQQQIDAYYQELAKLEGEAYERAQEKLIQTFTKKSIEFRKKYGTLSEKENAINEDYDYQIKEAKREKDYYQVLELTNQKIEELWKARNESRLEYLTQYGTSLEKELAITEKYDHLIENETDEFNKKILEARKKAEIDSIRQQSGNNIIFWDEKQLSRNTLKKALAEAEKELSRLRREGKSTNEEINVMLQRVQALREELENTRFGTNADMQGFIEGLFKLKEATDEYEKNRKAMLNASSAKEFDEYYKAVKENRENIEKQKEALRSALAGMAVQAFANGFQKAADAMQEIARTAGDVQLQNFADQFSSVAQNFSAAAQGFASGGWIGAIIGGATDILSQIYEGIVSSEVQEIQATKYAKNWEEALSDVSRQMQEINYYSPFGDLAIAKGREGARVAIETLNQYKDKLKEINGKSAIDNLREQLSAIYGGLGSYTFDDDWIRKRANKIGLTGESGLGGSFVVTKHRKWGNDSVSTLKELYPELFDNNGEIIIDNVKKLLEAESYLNTEQNKALREQLENLVKMKEEYDAAIKAIDDSISDTFGQLASSITDVIWDSVMNGADAWEQFGKVGSDVITALGKQLIQEMVISTYLDNFKDDMRKAYMLGSGTDTQTELRRIMGDIFGGLQTVLESGSEIAKDYKEWAGEHGFDLTEASERSTASKAISGVTQESFNEMSGRVTSIQLSAYNIDETTRAIRDQQAELMTHTAQMLLELQGIHGDTGGIREAVEGLRDDMTIIKSNLGTMTDKGVRMLN